MVSKDFQPVKFVVHPAPMGLPPGLSYDNVEELVAALEGATHK
jgi:hypothetical protein